MKTFSEIRNHITEGKEVYKSKIGKLPVKIVKDNKGFTAYLGKDKLDTFRSESDAKKALELMAKEL